MFLRLQKEKLKKVSRNMAQFNLDDAADDSNLLTHKGKVLGESNLQDDDFGGSSDEEDSGKLGKDIVERLHFGGGLVPVNSAIKGSGDAAEAGPRKGRLEALQEIVMKSKLHKMQRKEFKEGQESERERLDDAFDSLLNGSLVDFDPNANQRNKRSRDSVEVPEDTGNGVDLYDQSLQEMMFEAKKQPTDRTKTAEELAVEIREKMEEAEQARLKRMHIVAEDEAKIAKKALSKPGKRADSAYDNFNSIYGQAKGSKRHRNDDELDDFKGDELEDDDAQADSEEEEEEEEQFGEDAFDADADSDEEEGDEDDEEEGEEDDMEADEDEEEEGDEDDEEDGDNEDEDDDVDGDEEEEGEEEEVARGRHRHHRRPKAHAVPGSEADAVFETMPHVLPCPVTMADLDDQIASYCPGTSWEDKGVHVSELLQRIVQYNSVHLPGDQGALNKQAMGKLLSVLYKHFMRLGEVLVDSEHPQLIMQQLDHLSGVIYAVSADLPHARSSVITTRLLRDLQSQMQKSMLHFAQGESSTCFPSTGCLLSFTLLGQLYSVSDLKHDLMDAAKLTLCQMLSQCAVEHISDLCRGLLVCSTLLDYTADSKKVLPEVQTFLAQALLLFSPQKVQSQQHIFSGNTVHEALSVLRQTLATNDSVGSHIQWKMCNLATVDNDTAACVLHTIFALVDALIYRFEQHSALPEVTFCLFEALRSVRPHAKPALSKQWQQRTLSLLERFTAARDTIIKERVPLQWRPVSKVCVETKAPRFDVNYVFRKDTDNDKDRIKLKQLNRELKREKKAAMRELRRDSAFLDNERFQENKQAADARRDERVKNFAWMEEEQATINQQVRKGKGLMEMKGGGTGQLKALKKKMKR